MELVQLETGDVVRGSKARDGTEIIGVVQCVRENTLTVNDKKTLENETVRKETIEVISLAKDSSIRCERCGILKMNEGYRKLRNGKHDRTCKVCRGKKIKQSLNKEMKENKEVTKEVIEKIGIVLEESSKRCVKVGNAYIIADRTKNAVSVSLDYTLANNIEDLEQARQIADDFGGKVVAIQERVLLTEVE